MSIICSVCGQPHEELPHIGAAAPHYWRDELRDDPQCLLTDDLCIIEGDDFFVRGVIEIPVHGQAEAFGWGVWVSHKRENFELYREQFDSAEIGPFFGWLSTEITYFTVSTLLLKTMAHYRGQGLRPRIAVEPSDHLLSRHQQDGISLEEAWRIVHRYAKSE